MEIPKKEPLVKVIANKLTLLALVLTALGIVYFAFSALTSSITDKQRVVVDVATIGELEVVTKAFGHLKPARQSLLISSTKGLVQKIHVKPGVFVMAGDPLVTLNNIELIERLGQQELEVLELNAELEKLKANLNKEERVVKNELALTSGQLSISEIELEAKKKLFEENIISALEYKKSQLQVQQGKLNEKLKSENLHSFVLAKEAHLSSAVFKLKKAKQSLKYTESAIDKLTVKAPFDGLFSHISDTIELGAQVKAGEMLGAISDPDSLYGELNIAALDAVKLKLEQKVILNIKGQKVHGSVTRIEPSVKDNQVTFDVMPSSPLPSIARPNIEVSGKVVLASFGKGVLVNKPEIVTAPNDTYELYVKTKNEVKFKPTKVSIGDIANNRMRVLEGLNIGDSILISPVEDVDDIAVEEGGE